MGQSYRSLIFLLFAMVGVWAIAQSNDPEKEEWMERVAHLKTLLEQTDQERQGVQDLLAKAEAELDEKAREIQTWEMTVSQMSEEIELLRAASRERDQLKEELAAMTVEKDQAIQRCGDLTKGLKNLLEQDQIASAAPKKPVNATPVSGSRKTPGRVASRDE